MARKPKPEAEPVVIENDIGELQQEIDATTNAMVEHSHKIMERFGDGLPYERSRIVNEAKFYMATSAEAMLEAGKRLVILKENEPHGDFIDIVQGQLGMPPRTAQAMMQASIKYLSPKLESKAQALAHLGKTKLFELITEDDEQLAELADGGTIAGLNLDDIDRMSSRELRKALREAREQQDATQSIIQSKNKKIDDQAEQLMRIPKLHPDETAKLLCDECNEYCEDAAAQLRTQVRVALSSVYEHAVGRGEAEQGMEFIRGRVEMLQRTLEGIRFELGVDGAGWEDASA